MKSRDRRAAFGVGVFETVLVHKGRPFLIGWHAERMTLGLRTIGLAPRFDPAERVKQVLQALARQGVVPGGASGVLRMTAVSHPDRNEEGEFEIDFEEAPASESIRVMTAGTVVGGRRPGSPLAGVKSLAWAEYHVAREQARAAGFDEAILVDEAGRLLEGAASNLFVVRGGRVLTPPVSSGILPGVTRRLVFETAPSEGLSIVEQDLPLASLREADEAFLTNALIGVASLTAVDGLAIGPGVPGPVTQRLFDARRRRLEQPD